MRAAVRYGIIVSAGAVLGAGAAAAGSYDVSGSIAAEARGFVEGSRHPGQLDGVQASVILSPELFYESDDGRHQVSIAPYVRLDGRDDERTHVDLREAFWRYVGDGWELLAGVDVVFWGVTESRHLVDVVNQTDAVEDVDEEDKLGQPMLQLSLQRSWGLVEGFVLFGSRERTFAGSSGRVRPPLVVDSDRARYESGAGDDRIDLALRYSHYVGDWDIGVSAFHGTSREPRLELAADGASLVPFYEVISQLSTDLQFTREAWLLKLEALVRSGQGDTFAATVFGFEYTLYQLGGGAMDLGLLAEYLLDGRDESAFPTIYDDDLFVGARLALNDTADTALLGGAVIDREDGSVAAFVEAERRLGSAFKLELEGRFFAGVDAANALAPIARDSFVTVRLSYFF